MFCVFMGTDRLLKTQLALTENVLKADREEASSEMSRHVCKCFSVTSLLEMPHCADRLMVNGTLACSDSVYLLLK